MGIILFWASYIIAAILLYTLLRSLYKIEKIKDKFGYIESFKKTNERYKHPLWVILSMIIIFFIPFVNIIILAVLLGNLICENVCYVDSFLTKEY